MEKRKSKSTTVHKQPIKTHTIAENSNTVEVVDFYNDLLSSMQYPVTENFLRKLAENWIRWAMTDESALHPSKFILDAGIHWNTARRWCDKYEFLQEAYIAVKQILGIRREQKLVDARPDRLEFTLPDYLDEYKRAHEWRSDLKKQVAAVSGAEKPIYIVPDYFKD